VELEYNHALVCQEIDHARFMCLLLMFSGHIKRANRHSFECSRMYRGSLHLVNLDCMRPKITNIS